MGSEGKTHAVPPEDLRRLGLFARQVAHDFNNFLSSILGYASLLKGKIDPEDPRHRYAAMIETAGNEAGAVAERLLFFGRLWTQPASKIPVDLAALQEEIVRTLQGGPGGPAAEVAAERVEAKAKLGVDLRQLQRAIESLGTNACEAQAGDQTPRIAARFQLVGAEGLPSPPLAHAPSGRWLEIRISDPGKGMSEEILAQAFEPGFTTQPGARRPGLGLPITLGFVHSHAGVMDLISKPGEGTVVTLWLPVEEVV